MSSGGGQQQQSSTKVVYSPAEQAARDQIAVDAKQIFQNSMASNNGQYTGAKPVGPSDMTRDAWNTDYWAANTMGSANTKAQNANDFQMKDALYADANPYMQSHMDAATRPMIDQFMNAGGPMQAIRNNSVATGGYGGSRQGIAEGLAMQGLQQKVGDMRSTMSSDAYGKGLEAQTAAIKNQAMLNMMHQMPGQLQHQVGAQQEGYAQQDENYNAASRDYAKNYQWEPLQNFANVIYGGSNGTTQTSSTAPKTDHTGQIIGTLGTAAMMFMMM